MANKKRKKYKRKKNKNSSIFSSSIFKKFIYFAIAIVVAFFVWQIFFYSPPAKRVINIKEDREEIQDYKPGESSVGSALNYALKRLEIPQKFISKSKEGDNTYLTVIVDKNQLSLTICNIFITDTIEEAGGQVLRADESANRNSLEMKIFDPENKHYYILNIKLDNQGRYEQITRLAIIVDDFGYNKEALIKEFMTLDKSITFSIIPGLTASQKVMQKAYNQNRESMIHIPMEPISYPENDPGNNAIFVDYSEEEIQDLMQDYIKELPLCVGANNHMGSLATKYDYIMRPVLRELHKNDLFFVDSKTTTKTVAAKLATEVGINVEENNLFMDNSYSAGRVLRVTKKILNYAKTHDDLIAITHFRKSSLEELKKILKNLEGKNIKLTPISEIVRPKDYIL